MLSASAHVLPFVEIVQLGVASLVLALMADGGLDGSDIIVAQAQSDSVFVIAARTAALICCMLYVISICKVLRTIFEILP